MSTTEDAVFGSGLQAPPAPDPLPAVFPEMFNDALVSSLRPIEAVINAHATQEIETLKGTLGKAEAATRFQRHTGELREAWLVTEANRKRIADNPHLSPSGRAVSRAEDDARHEAEMARLDASAEQAIQGIGSVADTSRPPLTSDQAAAVSMLWARSDKQAARTTLEQAAEDLRIANDTTVSNETRYGANISLREFHSGWLARVDESPPPHYKPHAVAISVLRGAVDRHVDVTFGGYRQRTARAFADSLRGDWTWSRGNAREQGRFEDAMQARTVPSLFGWLNASTRGNAQ